MQESGVLLHISSLANSYGIGSLGKCAYDFVDFLSDAKLKYWQILPIGPSLYKDSPYQCLSTFAGNPYFIDLEILESRSLLNEEEVNAEKTKKQKRVDYGLLYKRRFVVLEKAFKRFNLEDEAYILFKEKNAYWLDDYCLFMSLKENLKTLSWDKWPSDFRYRKQETLKAFANEFSERIEYWKFIQFMFFSQFKELREYANKKGIKLIGDLPIYVAYDSSDVWSDPRYYQLDKNLNMTYVAGVPADSFNSEGQLWGNPLYNYKEMKKDNYAWWQRRIQLSMELFDIIRLDHFRGFESFYVIKANQTTAKYGHWQKGPGIDLWSTMKKSIPNLNIIAEDLGFLNDEVHALVRKCGFPGMKVLQFSLVSENKEDLPEYFSENIIIYPGTHDNPPIKAWLKTLSKNQKQSLKNYLALKVFDNKVNKIIECAHLINCKFSIVQIQDYLYLGRKARMNIPGTTEGNWTWRLGDKDLYKASKNIKKIYKKISNLKRSKA